MAVQLVIGGAFSGKRKLVKKTHERCSWVSAYEGDHVKEWKTKWRTETTLVVEGWEKWIAAMLSEHKSNGYIRRECTAFLQTMMAEEETRNDSIVLIMIEMGRGIVPVNKDERRLRDIAGWVAQDAAQLSEQVYYVWNGLSKRLK